MYVPVIIISAATEAVAVVISTAFLKIVAKKHRNCRDKIHTNYLRTDHGHISECNKQLATPIH